MSEQKVKKYACVAEDGTLIRDYEVAVHGEDAKKFAEQFAKKKGLEVKEIDEVEETKDETPQVDRGDVYQVYIASGEVLREYDNLDHGNDAKKLAEQFAKKKNALVRKPKEEEEERKAKEEEEERKEDKKKDKKKKK